MIFDQMIFKKIWTSIGQISSEWLEKILAQRQQISFPILNEFKQINFFPSEMIRKT